MIKNHHYENKNNNNYDYVYEIKGTYKNETVTFMYYKKNNEELLCIYKDKECLENFKKQIEE